MTELGPVLVRTEARVELTEAQRLALRRMRLARRKAPPNSDHSKQRDIAHRAWYLPSLAREIGVSRTLLDYWENGQRRPSLAHWLRWCEALGIDSAASALVEAESEAS